MTELAEYSAEQTGTLVALPLPESTRGRLRAGWLRRALLSRFGALQKSAGTVGRGVILAASIVRYTV
ncbi:MAG TPA: hypothetical protein VGC05_20575, partial [Mycobacterium sp.]